MSVLHTDEKGRAVSVVALATGSPLVRYAWSMPNKDTFSIAPIGEWVRRRLKDSVVSVDPFARNKRWATHTNDLNPATSAEHHMDARAFLAMLAERGVQADLVLFDPPYSPRQIQECYAAAGIPVGMTDTQNARLYSECRQQIEKIAAPGCRVLSFGWNSAGMGARWTREEILLVGHGGAHNDTICVCDRLSVRQLPLLEGNIRRQPHAEDNA
jgi:hypothetical protein